MCGKRYTPKRIDGQYCRPYCRLKAYRKRRREGMDKNLVVRLG